MVSLFIRTTENGKRVYRLADMKKQAGRGHISSATTWAAKGTGARRGIPSSLRWSL